MQTKKTNRACGFIMDYLQKGPPDDFGIIMGVELELEDRTNRINVNVIQEINKLPNFIVKSDSTLRNGGYEIVSAPLSLEDHKKSSEWGVIFGIADRWLQKSPHCGLHVHVNRSSGINPYFCRKLIYTHPKSFERVAHRSAASRYGQFDSTNILPQFRSQGVNTTNVDTVEFRLFSGTKNLIRLYEALEFVHSITRLSKDTNIPPSLDAWRSFIIGERVLYPSLYGLTVIDDIVDLDMNTGDKVVFQDALFERRT